MPSEWDRPPSVTEGVGNPTADQKKNHHHHHLHHHHHRSRRSAHTHSKMHHHYQHPRAPRPQHFCACVCLDVRVRSHCRASVFIIVIVCMTKGRIACIAVEGAILDGLIELHTCPAQRVCDWIPCSRSKWPEVYRHRALLTDAFVASRGFLLTQSDVTAASLRVVNNRHLTARTEDAEHCAYRLRCMMSQLSSAPVDKNSPPSKYDLLRGVMMMAHITAPLSQWQRVEFEEDRRLMGGRDGGFPRDQRYCFRCTHASTREVVVFCARDGVR